MEKINWNKIIDGLTVTMISFVLLTILTCTLVLLMFDTLAGTGSMMIFTDRDTSISLVISMATTGMTISLAFMAYLSVKHGYTKLAIVFVIASAFVQMIDIYFDSLSADALRFHAFVTISSLAQADRLNHILFRALMGGMSLIGEPLAVAIIVGMPELKSFIRGVLPTQRSYTPPTQPKPAPRRINDLPYEERIAALNSTRQSLTPRPVNKPVNVNEPTYHPVGYMTQEEEE